MIPKKSTKESTMKYIHILLITLAFFVACGDEETATAAPIDGLACEFSDALRGDYCTEFEGATETTCVDDNGETGTKVASCGNGNYCEVAAGEGTNTSDYPMKFYSANLSVELCTGIIKGTYH